VIPEVVDGDTVRVQLLDGDTPVGTTGQNVSIRFAGINTPEILYFKGPDGTSYGGPINDPNDSALAALNYLKNRLANNTRVVIRFDRQNLRDSTGTRYVGVIFHNVPVGTPDSERLKVLKDMATRQPLIPWDAFLDDGRPYTLNWEMIMTGYGNVEMRETLWDTSWRDAALTNRSYID
jgi:hypothetical protein